MQTDRGNPTFAETLKRERLAAGLTQEELAERASLSARAISDLERGVKQAPRRHTVQLLVAALQLSTERRTRLEAAARPRGDQFTTTHEDPPAPPLIAREAELARMEERLASARARRGGVVVVTGEPGIGKTRLAEQFARQAHASGALVLWGQCYEGEVSPPYGPWAQLLSSYAVTAEARSLRNLLGTRAPALARLIPQIRIMLPDVAPAAVLGADEERFRLHDAVAQFVLAITQRVPVVVVLDDLHWLDRDSLALFRHVARFASRAKLLLVGTYRDVELHRQDSLAETLRIVQHDTDYTRISLREWDLDKTASYLSTLAAQPLPQAFVRYIFDEAGGSPFYTRELFRHLVEEGTILIQEGRWSTEADLRAAGIPQGVREVVGLRIAHLAATTQHLLRNAAAFTGGFAFGVLPDLTGLDEATLLDAIDEAVDAGLVRTSAGPGETYSFSHAIVRHAVYDELSPSRRARIHRRIAETLAALRSSAADDADAEIAAQYQASASLPGAERGVDYALRAAEHARASYAPEQRIALLRLAHDLVERSEPFLRADVLKRLAVAEAEGLVLDNAPRTVEAALTAMELAAADAGDVASFLDSVALPLKQGGAPPAIWEPLVERGLAILGERRDLAWARLRLLQDRYVPLAHGSINAAHWLGHDPEAVACLRQLGDEQDYARSLDPLTWRERAETDAIQIRLRTWTRPTAILQGLNVVARDQFYRHGNFRAAVDRYTELLEAARRYGSVSDEAEALAQLAALRVTLGEFAQARRTLTQAEELVGRLGEEHRLHFVTLVGAPAALGYFTGADWPTLLERTESYLVGSQALRSPLGLMAAAFAALAYLRTDNAHAALRTLDSLTPVVEHLDPRFYMHNHVVSIAGAVIWEVESTLYAPVFRRLALGLVDAGVAPGCVGANELTIARMAALGGDYIDARTWFARARVLEDSCGQRAARAQVDLDEAKLLLSQGPQETPLARTLLQSAASQFASLGMDTWSERAASLIRLAAA